MDPRIAENVLAQFGIAGLVVLSLAIVLFKLSTGLARLRTDLQHQVTRDWLDKRFAAYGELWAHLRPLAIYTDTAAPRLQRRSGKLQNPAGRDEGSDERTDANRTAWLRVEARSLMALRLSQRGRRK
jgi:hypothetical protein